MGTPFNPRQFALQMGLLDNEDDYNDPIRQSMKLGLTDSEKDYQSGIEPQENYLDDNLGSVTRSLPIDQPSGSIVSGGREDLYHKYSQMLEQKPESERVLEDYMGRRPTREQFSNSGNKLTAAVMGGIAGLNRGGEAGIATAQNWRDKPFNEAMQDYNSEGKYVNDYAKLQDSGRNRQLNSLLAQMRLDEQQRMDQARMQNYQSLDKDRRQRSIDRSSEANAREEERGLARKDRDRNFNATERHRRAIEGRIKEKDPLAEFKSLRGKEKGWTVLDSLGFGQGNDVSQGPTINPITGKPYTPEEVRRMGTIGEGVK